MRRLCDKNMATMIANLMKFQGGAWRFFKLFKVDSNAINLNVAEWLGVELIEGSILRLIWFKWNKKFDKKMIKLRSQLKSIKTQSTIVISRPILNVAVP